MDKISLELASSILGLELQKEKLLNDINKKERLCFCRSKILQNYINVCQLFHIRLMSKIIKFLEDYNVEASLERSDLSKWYNIEMYDKLLGKSCVNNKMILLMRLLQDKIDKEFFQEYNIKFEELIRNYNGNKEYFVEGFRNFFYFINEWMDNHILGILSCKIDCYNIDDKIVSDYNYLLKNSECFMGFKECSVSTECNNCVRYDNLKGCTECPSRSSYSNGEDVHMYLTDELLKDSHICNFIDTVYMYHNHPKNINIVFDYIMFDDPMDFDIKKLDRLNTISSRFKSLSIINAENVDFGENLEFIRPFLKPKEMN